MTKGCYLKLKMGVWGGKVEKLDKVWLQPELEPFLQTHHSLNDKCPVTNLTPLNPVKIFSLLHQRLSLSPPFSISPMCGLLHRLSLLHLVLYLLHADCRHRPKNSLFFSFLLFLFFLDTDPHLASVICDLYLFSVSRYELSVCGNMCTCVRVSTNLESPPIMGNFKVWLGTYV